MDKTIFVLGLYSQPKSGPQSSLFSDKRAFFKKFGNLGIEGSKNLISFLKGFVIPKGKRAAG